MKSLPADVLAYHQTREFDEATVPSGLLDAHTTKAGVWGRIVVVEGALCYEILGAESEVQTLVPGGPGVIEPEVPHRVQPEGPVRFFVEFLRGSRETRQDG